GADIEGVLGTATAWTFALELAMRLLVGLGLLERGDLRLGQQDALLRHLGFERRQAVLDRGQIVTQPHAAHAGGRNRQAAPLQRLRYAHLTPGGLIDRQSDHRLFDLNRRAVLQHRLTAADLLQCQLAAFIVELLEAIEAVAAVPHHLASLADIAELLGELQQSDLRPNDLLLLCHFVISVPPKGGSRSQLRVRNRAPPSGSFRKPTTTVRFSSSYYTG